MKSTIYTSQKNKFTKSSADLFFTLAVMCDFEETDSTKEIVMKYKHAKGDEIEGELDIFVSHNEDEGVITKRNEILIHGNPEGLKSLAKLLLEIAEINQDEVEEKYLPIGKREHYDLKPNIELSKSSNSVIIGRLNAKGTSECSPRFKPKEKIK